MKNIFFSIILLYCSNCIAVKNSANSFYLGKLGLSSSGVEIFQNNNSAPTSCMKRVHEELSLDFRLRVYATCKNYQKMMDIIRDEDNKSFSKYIAHFKSMKSVLNSMLNKKIDLNLRIIFLDANDHFKKNVHSLVFDKYKMMVGVQFVDLHHVPDYTNESELLTTAISTVSHEFYHHFVDKELAKNSNQKFIRKDRDKEEAIAEIVGLCVGALTVDGNLVTPSFKDISVHYKKGFNGQKAFEESKIGQSVLKTNNKQYIEAVKSYILGIYSLWEKFGTEIKPEERAKFMGYCNKIAVQPMEVNLL